MYSRGFTALAGLSALQQKHFMFCLLLIGTSTSETAYKLQATRVLFFFPLHKSPVLFLQLSSVESEVWRKLKRVVFFLTPKWLYDETLSQEADLTGIGELGPRMQPVLHFPLVGCGVMLKLIERRSICKYYSSSDLLSAPLAVFFFFFFLSMFGCSLQLGECKWNIGIAALILNVTRLLHLHHFSAPCWLNETM